MADSPTSVWLHDDVMTSTYAPGPTEASDPYPTPRAPSRRRSSWLQLAVGGLALVAPAVIVVAVLARLTGQITTGEMVELALGAGENPGTFTFAAMFLASPIQWLTGRSQVRIRKFLGIVFYGLAVNNFVMFIIERGQETVPQEQDGLLAEIARSPFLLAGSVALLLATPLFLTSTRWSQRTLGMRRWRLLHRLTYVVAIALVLHVLLIPDIGPDTALLAMGFTARIPAVRRRLAARGQRRRGRQQRERLSPAMAGAV